MSCRQFIGELGDYLDGAQVSARLGEIELHLQGCGRCRILCETVRRTVWLYKRSWPACAPDDVRLRLRAALEKRTGIQTNQV